MTKMKHAWFPATLSFVLTHSSTDLSNECVSTKLGVTGNHAWFFLVILNCTWKITLFWSAENSQVPFSFIIIEKVISVSTKRRVTGNHACFILVILNCTWRIILFLSAENSQVPFSFIISAKVITHVQNNIK